MKLISRKTLLGVSQHDTATPSGRSRIRRRQIAWTSMSGAVSSVSAIAVSFISIPLLLNYLGAERFGMWVTLTSIVAMIGASDLGLGNGVLNLVARANGKADEVERVGDVVAAVSSGFFVLVLVSLLVLSAGLLTLQYVPWVSLLNLSASVPPAEPSQLSALLLLGFALSLPLVVTHKAQVGLQQGYWPNLIEGLGSVLGLLTAIIVISYDGDLIIIACAIVGMPLLLRGFNTIWYFGFACPELRPRLTSQSLSTARRLFNSGSLFFLLQVSAIVAFQADNFIIATILGAESVADYAIGYRLATVPMLVVGVVVVAQWPAYAEARERGDVEWIASTYYRTLIIGVSLSVGYASVFYLFGESLVKFWAGTAAVLSPQMLLGMSIWSVLLVAGSIVASLFNGLHIVKLQVVCASFMAVSNIVLSIWFVRYQGAVGAVYGSIVAYTICTLVPCVVVTPSILKRLSRQRVSF